MAKDTEIGLKIKVKGGREAKRELAGLVQDAEKQIDAVQARGMGGGPGGGARGGRGRAGRGRGRAGMGGKGIGIGGVAAGAFIAGLAIEQTKKVFSAMSSLAGQTFTPGISTFEKTLGATQAVISLVPGVGPIASSIIGARAQPALQALRETASGTGGRLQKAAEAFGMMNPDATQADFRDEFKGLIQDITEFEAGKAKGRMFLAKELGRAAGEALGLDSDTMRDIDDALNKIADKGLKVAETFGVINEQMREFLSSGVAGKSGN